MTKIKFAILLIVLIPFSAHCQEESVAPAAESLSAPVNKEQPVQKESVVNKSDASQEKSEVKPVLNIKKVENNLLSFELRDADIRDLFRVIAYDYKMNFVMDKGVEGKITLSFNNIDLDQALNKIAEASNLQLVKTDNIINVKPNLITKTFVLKYTPAKTLAEPLSAQSPQTTISSLQSSSSSGNNQQSSGQQGGGNTGAASYQGQAATGAAAGEQPGGTSNTKKASTIFDLLSEQGKIFFDNQANSILVIDYPQNIKKVADYLEKIDVLPKQVLIEARIIEVKLQKEHALGVNWQLFANKGLKLGQYKLYSDTIANGLQQAIPYKPTYYPPAQTATGQETPFSVTIFDENINVVLKALSNSLKTDILSSPRVTTVNNQEAVIKVVQSLPWAEPELTVEGQSGSVSVSWKVNFEEVGILLKANPTINENGDITMTLVPEVSEKTSDYTLTVKQGATEVPYTVPVIDKRTASTKVVIGSGQTLVIGGLIKNKITKGVTKVPIFGDIPYLGYLFKSKKDVGDKSELFIFVSPTVITPNEFVHMERTEKYGIGKDYMEERQKQEIAVALEEQEAKTREANKAQAAKVEAAKVEAAKAQAVKVEAAKAQAAKVEAVKVEVAKVEAANANKKLIK